MLEIVDAICEEDVTFFENTGCQLHLPMGKIGLSFIATVYSYQPDFMLVSV